MESPEETINPVCHLSLSTEDSAEDSGPWGRTA